MAVNAMHATALNIRITRLLNRCAGMGHRSVEGGADLLRVLPQIARGGIICARFPFGLSLRKFGIRQPNIKGPGLGIEINYVAVPQKRDRASHRRLRADMSDTETAG